MTIKARVSLVPAFILLFAGASSFAQSSAEATYKAKCQMCHGAAAWLTARRASQ